MSHKFEDLQAKTDKLVEEAERDYENNQPITTTEETSSANHHQWEGFERGYFIHLSREHCLNYRKLERTRMSNRARIGKARNTFINHHYKPIWKSSLSINNNIRSDFQYKRQVSQFFYTDEKLGGSQRIFPTACCRPLSTTVLASSMLKIRQPGWKESPTRNYGNKLNKARTNRQPTNMQEEVEMDRTLAEETAG
uniref:Uncharacterized protein n=1 Tax=Trichobilharzia regenti TaxID=157069 RepID=A0AA85JAG1_TRIRE|nr:unnamed protein product [Trichobilharzia regenti]